MTPVGQYLRKLLYQYDCIVVGDLGAFLIHAAPAQFTPATGQYLPPRKQVAFNEALRLDDGILANYVMLHDDCTREEANRRIGQFAAEVRQGATNGYTLPGIGLFTLNEENRLGFDPELRHNFNGDSFGLPPISVTRLEAVLPTLALTNDLSETVLTEPALSVDQEGGTILPLQPRRQLVWRWAAAAVLVGSLGFVGYYSVMHPGQLLQSSVSPGSLLRLPTLITPPAAATPKFPLTHIPTPEPTVAMSSPAVIATPAPAIPDNKVTVAIKSASVPVVKTTVNPVKPAEVAAVPVSSAEKRLAAVKRMSLRREVKARIAALNFVVVAGSFASKPNALRFRRTLHKAGYTDAYIIIPAKTGQLYKVAAVGTTQLTDAQTNADSLGKLTGIPAWIFRFNHR